jgi:hypothetical protein
MDYMAMLDHTSKCAARTAVDFMNPTVLLEAYARRAAWVVAQAERKLAAMEQTLPFDEAWNKVGWEMIRASDAHCYLLLVNSFYGAIQRLETNTDLRTRQLAVPLTRCLVLFALHWMTEHAVDFISSGYLDAAQAEVVRDAVREVMDEGENPAVN